MIRKLLVALATLVGAVGLVGIQGAGAVGGSPARPILYRTFPNPPYPQYPYFAVDHQLQVEQTSDAVGYFYASQFGFVNGNIFGGYSGLQTRIDSDFNGQNDNGRGFIFSIWDATGCTATYPGAHCGTFANEGSGWSLRLSLNWATNNTYQFDVAEQFTNGVFNGHVHVTVFNKTVPTTYSLGDITVPTSFGAMKPGESEFQFTELYSPTSFADCNTIPVSKAKFYAANWMTPLYPHSSVYFSSTRTEVTSGAGVCPNAGITDLGAGSYREIVGATS